MLLTYIVSAQAVDSVTVHAQFNAALPAGVCTWLHQGTSFNMICLDVNGS